MAQIFRIEESHYQSILARHANLGDADPWLILGVERGSPLEEVKKRYRKLVAANHPDKLVAAAASSPNFGYRARVSTAPARNTLPLMVFQGDRDRYLRFTERHWQFARQFFEQHGFTIARTVVPGLGHDRCPSQVQDFFAGFLGKPAVAATE